MGNINTTNSNKSAQQEFKNFYEVIDYIATYYILTMDFKSLRKLSEKSYCDNLVVLTSDIIKRYFNDMEITYLAQRVKNGVEVNDLKTDKVIFVNKDKLDSLDISNDTQKSIKKKRVCIGIAKFYIKIAHVFAAIVMTINPVYTYKGPNGETMKTGLLKKDTIPKNSQRKLYKINICDNRIRALKKGEVIDDITGNVTLQPKICEINMGKNGQVKTLNDEPGIPELMKLYLDDNYDYSNGTFTGMSNNTKNQFLKDLNLFYTAFTGNSTLPPEITKFSDIKLRDYNSKKGCQVNTPFLKSKYTLNKKDKLFVEYADNITKMIQNAADNQSKLLSIINDLFTYIVDPYTGKKVIRVNPNLTDESLQKVVDKARRLIVDLYVKCENDYTNGLKIYEAIVETKILETTEKQIENLENSAKKMIYETKQTVKPVPIPQTINSNNNVPPFVINEPLTTTNTTSPSESIIESDLTQISNNSLPSSVSSAIETSSTPESFSTMSSNTSSTPSSTPSSATSSATSSNTMSSDTSFTPSSTTSFTPSSATSFTPSSATSFTPSSATSFTPSSETSFTPSSTTSFTPSSTQYNPLPAVGTSSLDSFKYVK